MLFREGGTPRVITVGAPLGAYNRRALVPYTDDPHTGLRWVAMDQAFVNDLLPALLQQNVLVEWVEDHDYVVALRALAQELNIAWGAVSVGALVQAALTRLRTAG